MPNYLAVDSGGTKVLAVLYDENFQPIRISRVGSCRENTTGGDLVDKHLAALKEELKLTKDMVIEQVTGIMDTSFEKFLLENCTVKKIVHIGEPKAAFSAAEIFGDGIMALSGTGSNLAIRYNGGFYDAGGYGAAVSDAGSGYWIGRNVMEAAIADYEGRGAYTMLTDLLAGYLGYDRTRLREAIFSIYDKTEISATAHVASCATLATKAANEGDAIALEILKAAGQSLGDQITALIRLNQIPDDLPLTISGSAWKSHRILFDTFVSCVRSQSPKRPIVIPKVEPILGVMFYHYHTMHGELGTEVRRKFQERYSKFAFQLPFSVS